MLPRIGVVALVGLVLVPVAAWSQGNPLGPEFRVNTYITGNQGSPSVDADSGGNFVVVWASEGQDGSGWGVFGQRYSSSGSALGPEFQVNTYTTNNQMSPAVAADSGGNVVVVWRGVGQDHPGVDIYGRRYASSGAPLGTEFRVSSFGVVSGPSVAADSLGNFVVVWEIGQAAVWGQRFASSGVPLGSQFQVFLDPAGTTIRANPTVASDPSGNFVVTWVRGVFDFIMGRRYSNAGTPLGAEFVVASEPPQPQWGNNYPAVAAEAGGFVVVWSVGYLFTGPFDILGRGYNSAGVPQTGLFQVNAFMTGSQEEPAVATDPSGNFVVVWKGDGQGGAGIFGRRFLSSSVPLSSDFRVNTNTIFAKREPSVAVDSLGNFVVVWNGNSQDGSADGVFGQRYAQIVPVELIDFTIE